MQPVNKGVALTKHKLEETTTHHLHNTRQVPALPWPVYPRWSYRAGPQHSTLRPHLLATATAAAGTPPTGCPAMSCGTVSGTAAAAAAAGLAVTQVRWGAIQHAASPTLLLLVLLLARLLVLLVLLVLALLLLLAVLLVLALLLLVLQGAAVRCQHHVLCLRLGPGVAVPAHSGVYVGRTLITPVNRAAPEHDVVGAGVYEAAHPLVDAGLDDVGGAANIDLLDEVGPEGLCP
mmetsp:Transcript_389/g.795  ORF Transcript_389/g.795 Transcript_389/m.795 type:complete len:233 (-) Transcript_389:52-750(-)|eukprot:CAMPEP_0202924896 /NCGR_PEP_ID=MMETSP1392-20130828/79217_1 /ASSEMBLY_ACC=CAM_ASM_000868 /TAXON_ID=225041 /ORGANISM="Chlamydomonas chlamydogama, Strain SAG 11-48b" /LENGTH=232 /DNA_ID=CAMNT_0049618653 /DNA_START=294 /DNA_END=992 /DNA_ORIENTATION=+